MSESSFVMVPSSVADVGNEPIGGHNVTGTSSAGVSVADVGNEPIGGHVTMSATIRKNVCVADVGNEPIGGH